MPQRSFQFSPPTNPFLQVLYFVVGGIILIGAIIMGAVVLSIALGLGIILGLVIMVRIWWLKRKLRSGGGDAGAGSAHGDGTVYEVEYRVVEERDERDDPGSRQ